MNRVKLSALADYVLEKKKSNGHASELYIGVDNMLPDHAGVRPSDYPPEEGVNVTIFKPGDILIGNIRPYFKKIWLADCPGCCSADVLVLRPKAEVDSGFLFAALSDDAFFGYVMKGAKGTQMPRGDKGHIMDYPVAQPSNQHAVSELVSLLDTATADSKSICSDLDAAAKLLYDYWFVQFDFPDENGRPYKSSGGKMVWNDELKREIPAGWSVGNLYDIAEYANGLACQKYRPLEGDKGLPVIKIKEMHGGYSSETERVKSNIPDKNIVRPGDLLFSWSASLEVMIWTRQTGGLNQHIFKVIPKRPFNRSYVYFQLGSYLAQFKRMAESRKTTMGHITSDHLEQSRIVLPPSTLLDMYSNKTSSLIDQIVEVSGVAETLTDIRDYTLPLLMNGQVTIGDDDK